LWTIIGVMKKLFTSRAKMNCDLINLIKRKTRLNSAAGEIKYYD